MRQVLLAAGFLYFLAIAPLVAESDNIAPEVQTTSYRITNARKLYQGVLDRYVTSKNQTSLVDYQSLQKNPAKLTAYLQYIGSIPEADFHSLPKQEQLAVLINLYNASTLKLIIDHYPLQSIQNIKINGKQAWDLTKTMLFSKKISLNHLEHEIIRQDYEEPRIHFAVVCAAMGCPPLQKEAYSGEKLEQQLEEVTRNFISNPERNYYSKESNTLYLSQIFSWYKADFGNEIDLKLFIGKYINQTIPASAEIKYLKYNWELNSN